MAASVFGLLAVNGTFVYGLLFVPEAFVSALANPIGLAFMVEAFVLLVLFTYLFERWGVSRIKWGWFVVLSLLGSMAFAVPLMLLFPRRQTTTPDA